MNLNTEQWTSEVSKMDLKGTVKQLASHCTVEQLKEGDLLLNIDPEKCRLIISGGGVKHQILMSDISICTKILDIKKTFKHIPQNFNSFNSKILVYLGLIAYWGVILVGTFFHIN